MDPLININKEDQKEECSLLLRICEHSLGLSGRSLRKIPFIAHALFLNQSLVNMKDFLEAMEMAVSKEKSERNYFEGLKEEKI